MTPLHLGGLHPYEQALTLLLAFGPFVALGVLVLSRRRREARAGSVRSDPAAEEEGARPPSS